MRPGKLVPAGMLSRTSRMAPRADFSEIALR